MSTMENPFDQLLIDALQALAIAAPILAKVGNKGRGDCEAWAAYARCMFAIRRGNKLFAEKFGEVQIQ